MSATSEGPIERSLASAMASRQSTQLHSTIIQSAEVTPAPLCLNPISIPLPPSNIRKPHKVATLSQRRVAIRWMHDTFSREGKKHLFAKTVRNFPLLFTGNYKANLAKASAWCSKRNAIADLSVPCRRLGNLVGMACKGRRRLNIKAFPGRGRKRELWVTDLYVALRSEFDRLHALDVKLSPSFLVCAAKHLIDTAEESCSFSVQAADNQRAIRERITIRWVQTFMQVHGLVIRRQAGNLATNHDKKIYIEKTVAFHLGALKRGFNSGSLQEDMVENADETHFVFNMDNGRTIGFRGQDSVKYADVVSGDEGITMMVRLTGGIRAKIEAPMLVFINQNGSYPIRGVSDNVPGVSYRSGKKGWMDSRVFKEWLSEPRAIKADFYGRKRVLFVDNVVLLEFGKGCKSLVHTIRES